MQGKNLFGGVFWYREWGGWGGKKIKGRGEGSVLNRPLETAGFNHGRKAVFFLLIKMGGGRGTKERPRQGGGGECGRPRGRSSRVSQGGGDKRRRELGLHVGKAVDKTRRKLCSKTSVKGDGKGP